MAKVNDLPEQTRDELADITMRLSGNKGTRKEFLSLLKKVAPETPIPELDSEAALEERLAAERKANQERWDKLEQEKLQERLAKQKAEFTAGMTDEQVKQMETMMEKGELPADYKWGSQLFRQQIEPVAGSTYSSGNQGWGPFDLPSAEGLMDNEQNWSLRTAHQIVDEMRNQKSKPF